MWCFIRLFCGFLFSTVPLEILLDNNASVIFDNYFEVCAGDLSCLVSLPSKEGLYYVVDDTVTVMV